MTDHSKLVERLLNDAAWDRLSYKEARILRHAAATALESEYRRGLEEAAKVCEINAVIGNTPTATGYMAVLMETNAPEYNIAGVCYAAAIRAKAKEAG